jgi:simple sugar transport system permease protein
MVETRPNDGSVASGSARRWQPPDQSGGFLGAQWFEERRGRGALEIATIFVAIQLALAIWYFFFDPKDRYLSAANLSVMTQAIPWLALLAIGSGIVIIAGEIDLSIAMNMGMSQLVFLTWYQGGNSPYVSAVAAICVAVIIGLFNAFMVNVFRIPSLIATLGMFGFLWGLQQWYVGGDGQAPRVSSDQVDTTFQNIITYNLWHGIRAQMLWLIGIAAIMWVLMHRHRLGNHIMSVGGNENAARAISINPVRIRFIAFALLGLLAGIAAVLQGVQQKTLVPGSTRGIELDAIAGAIIGGTALRGGKGTVLGMVLGVGLLKTFQAIVLLTSLPAFYLETFSGAMIIVFAVINQFFEGKAK